jgi:hypothetical protein
MKSIDIRKYKGAYEVFIEQADGDFIVQTFAAKADAEIFVRNLAGQGTELTQQPLPPPAFYGSYGNRDRL